MDEQTLKAKIDDLGQKMYEMKQLEARFDEEHAAEIIAINDLRKEISEAVIDLGRTVETMKLRCEFRRGSGRWDTRFQHEGKPTVAFVLKDEEPFDNE